MLYCLPVCVCVCVCIKECGLSRILFSGECSRRAYDDGKCIFARNVCGECVVSVMCVCGKLSVMCVLVVCGECVVSVMCV